MLGKHESHIFKLFRKNTVIRWDDGLDYSYDLRNGRFLNPKFFVCFNPDKLNPEFIVPCLLSRGSNPHEFGARVNSVLFSPAICLYSEIG